MIRINLTLREENEKLSEEFGGEPADSSVSFVTLVSMESEGHAGTGKPGEDILCAAVSVLLRTSFRSLETLRGVELNLTKPVEPGCLSYQVIITEENGERLSSEIAGITRFLLTGLRDLAEEYPDNLILNSSFID